MKKILSLIGTLAIISSASTTVVACGKGSFERFSNPAIQDAIKQWIIAQINSENESSYVKYSFNDIFTKADLKALAVRLLDTNISKYFFASEEATRARYTGVTIDVNQPDSAIAKQIVHFVEEVALDKLYTEYLSGISNNNPLELTIASSGYAPDYQTATWYVGGVQSYFWSGTGTFPPGDYTKSKAELEKEGKTFVLDRKAAGADYTDFNNMATEKDKKTALKVRFADYYTHVEVPSIIDNILSATYLHQNEIKRYGSGNNSSIYLNRNSALFNAIQSWDTVSGSKWNSYVKMAWELKLDKSSLDKLLSSGGAFADLVSINNNLTTAQNTLTTTIKDVFNTKTNNNVFDNLSSEGIDPIFGISGFKGFVGIDKSKNPEEVFTTLNNADSYKTDLINAATPGFLKPNEGTGPSSWEYLDSNKKYGSIILVLQIYTIDLMHNMNINYQDTSTNNKQLSLNWYGSGGAVTNLDQAWLAQQQGARRSLTWLYDMIGYLGTNKEDGTPLYDANGILTGTNPKGQILKWIEYTFAQNSSLQTAAKTRLYSLAFGYNPENIYSQTLYDAIGTYVTKDD